jgi:hypothetical protein
MTSYALSAPVMAVWRLARGPRHLPATPPATAEEAALRPVVLDKPGIGG